MSSQSSTPTRRRIVVTGLGKIKVDDSAAFPKPRSDFITVRVHAVACNPTDWKHIDTQPITGGGIGVDFAGVVEAVPDEGTLRRKFKVGDRVLGSTHGGNESNPEDGAFAELVSCGQL